MQIVVYRNTFLINELLNCQLYIASDDDFLILIRIASNRKSTNGHGRKATRQERRRRKEARYKRPCDHNVQENKRIC